MKLYQGMTKSKTALLVIDPVNSCAHKNCETPELNIHFSKIRKMLPKLNKFIKQYRESIGGLVVISTTTPWNKEHLAENINRLYTDPKATYYSDDTSGFNGKFHTVETEESDFIITKNSYDVFTNQQLTAKLKKQKIKFIVVTGVFTDGCVLSSVISGFSKGYNFIILKDLVETTDSETRQQLQKLLIKYTFPVMYGKTISSEEFKRLSSPSF